MRIRGFGLNDQLGLTPICWVVDAVVGWDVLNRRRIDAFQTADVVAVLVWIRAPLVVRVDATV